MTPDRLKVLILRVKVAKSADELHGIQKELADAFVIAELKGAVLGVALVAIVYFFWVR